MDSGATLIKMPDGSWAIGIECNGRGASQITCLGLAGNECPGGYDVLEDMGHEADESHGRAFAGRSFASARSDQYETHHGTMLIRCHGPSRYQVQLAEQARLAKEALAKEAE